MKNLEDIKNSKTKHKYIDDNRYLYSLSLDDINDKRNKGHSKFSKNNPYTIQNIKTYLIQNNISTNLLSTIYKGAKKGNYLLWECGICHKSFKRQWANFQKGKYKYCSQCINEIQAKEKRNSLEEVRDICKEYGYNLLSNEYYNNKTSLDIEDKQGYKGSMHLNGIQNGNSILKFSTTNKYFFYNTRHYFKINGYNCDILETDIKKRKQKFTFKCECGREYTAKIDEVLNSNKPRIRCKTCTNNISNGENKVIYWLNHHNIKYIQQKRFDDCKYRRTLPFDFYLPEQNICIEVDGQYHYTRQEHVSEEDFLNTQLRDKIKTEYCLENGIKLIRIPYWEIYNNKYKEKLKKNILM